MELLRFVLRQSVIRIASRGQPTCYLASVVMSDLAVADVPGV